jgi:hypothetical protein
LPSLFVTTHSDELAREDPNDERNRVDDEPEPVHGSRYVVILGWSVYLPLNHHDQRHQQQQQPARYRQAQDEQADHDESE